MYEKIREYIRKGDISVLKKGRYIGPNRLEKMSVEKLKRYKIKVLSKRIKITITEGDELIILFEEGGYYVDKGKNRRKNALGALSLVCRVMGDDGRV